MILILVRFKLYLQYGRKIKYKIKKQNKKNPMDRIHGMRINYLITQETVIYIRDIKMTLKSLKINFRN